MTDQEHKKQIIRKRLISENMNQGMSLEEATENTESLFKEISFINFISICMDEWAGVISTRINEADEKEN